MYYMYDVYLYLQILEKEIKHSGQMVSQLADV